jgi:hypothetical protein
MMKLFNISRTPTKTEDDGKWIVDPYLHLEKDHVYSPITDKKFAEGDQHYEKLRSLIDGKLSVESLPRKVQTLFRENGWIVSGNGDVSRRFLLKYVSLEAHTVCNQACTFCPVSMNPRDSYFMPTEHYESILKQLAAYRSTIEAVIMINYNEPTIDKRFVEQVRTIKAHGLPPAVLSNGSGLTPAKVDALMEMGGLRFLSINLSTLDKDRYKQERGVDHLDIVLRNLDYVKDRKLAEEMDMVVLGSGDDTHRGDYEAIKARFSGSFFNVKYFEVMDRAGYLPLGLKPDEPHQKLCGCDNVGSRPLQHLHISPHGKCLLCCEDYDEKYVVGNLNYQTVEQVLTGAQIQTMRRWIYGLEEAPTDFMCRKCVFARSRS